LQTISDRPTHSLAVSHLGAIAHECVQQQASGAVVALFDSSFYFRAGPAFVCVGTSRMGMGPLNIRSTAHAGFDWAGAGVRVGNAVVIRDRFVLIGGIVGFDLSGPVVWHPPGVDAPAKARAVAAGLAALDRIAVVAAPADGLAALVWNRDARPLNPVLDLAAAPTARLFEWLARSFRGHMTADDNGPDDIGVLLGLGPGLTPSGDDLVGGVLIALNALGRRRDLKRLADAVRRHVDEQTSPLSAAHLAAAARGMGSQALHEVLESLLTNDADSLGDRVGRLARIGHTSGWDALAGVVIAVRAWLSSTRSTDDCCAT
jgi:hypothetical protein